MNRSIKNIFLVFWATAVLAICVGSLINFHQHKIWGKPILGEILYTKRDKEQSVDLLQSFKADLATVTPAHVFGGILVILDTPLHLVSATGDTFYYPPALPEYSYYLILSGSLRAPPVA